MGIIGIYYWSGTGNTEIMAQAIAKALNLTALPVAEASAEQALEKDKLLLGCPAMGSEELEDSEFEPFFAGLEAGLKGKKVALFGSYGWGDGEWMRAWQDRVTAAGGELFEEGLMAHETPDDASINDCEAFAARFEQA